MAAEEPKKIEPEAKPESNPAEKAVDEVPKAEAEDKSVIPAPISDDKPDDSKALAIVETKATEPSPENEGSVNRDTVLARVATEKRLSLIRAWEDSEKSKAENKAQKNISSIGSWENSKKASLEAKLKKIEENLEKKKAAYVEKLKNQMAMIHKTAEERRAGIEAQKGEDLIKAEETAAKYRATNTGPKKLLGCF